MLISGPEQCQNYNLLDSRFRNHENRGQEDCSGGICCDRTSNSNKLPDWKGSAWYRIGGQAGTQLNEKGTGVRGSCGAHWGGYLSGGHPTAQEYISKLSTVTVNTLSTTFLMSIRVTLPTVPSK